MQNITEVLVIMKSIIHNWIYFRFWPLKVIVTFCFFGQRIQNSVADPGLPRRGGENLLFGQNGPENYMKMKEIGPR